MVVAPGVGSLQEQVRQLITQEIASGAYPAGARLPTEKTYAERLGVSLITVRGALAALVQVGYIERASGRGTFVAAPRVPYVITLRSSATDTLRAAGVVFDMRVVTAEYQQPPEVVQHEMGLRRSATAFRLRRVAVVRGAPALLLDSWVRRSSAKGLEHNDSFATGASLYAFLSRHGVELAQAEGRIRFGYADDEQASNLNLPFGAPLLIYDSKMQNAKGLVIERAQALYDANRFALTVSPEVETS